MATICEDLNITVEDIKAITVNYNVLTIKTFDDKTLTYEFDSILIEEDIDTSVKVIVTSDERSIERPTD